EPKPCTLSLAMIERNIVTRGDFEFTISCDNNKPETFKDGHILLLSDLLIFCRTKTSEEIRDNPDDNESIYWLLFPPLAVRHVFATDVSNNEEGPVMELRIVNRVKARVYMPNDRLKDNFIMDVNGAQQADASKSSQPPPQNLSRNQSVRPPMGGP